MSVTKQQLISQLDKIITQHNKATDKAPGKLEVNTTNQVEVDKAINNLVTTFENKKALTK